MDDWIPPRLRALLGSSLREVGVDEINRLVGLSEDGDLEFKSEIYGRSDGEKREAALDLACLANAGGGLVVFGLDEDGEGVATALRPDISGGDFLLWLDQIAASRISPLLSFSTIRIETEGGSLYLASVPPSMRRPHSVTSGDTLRFPIRAGRHRRYLSESEIADHYGRRFEAVAERSSHLDQLIVEGRTFASRGEERWIWLILALVPDVPGELRLNGRLVSDWQEWVSRRLRDFPCYNQRNARYSAAVGFRSIVIHDSIDSHPTLYRMGGELKLDGRGFLVFGYLGGDGDVGASAGSLHLYDEFVVADLINGLGVLAEHARRTGSSGEVEVAAQIIRPSEPLTLNQYRGWMPGMLPGSRGLVQDVEPVRRTFTIDGSADAGPEQVGNVRLLAGDMFSAFGVAEPLQINDRFQLIEAGFHAADTWPGAKNWAERNGVGLA